MELLNNYGKEKWEVEIYRVQIAILKLSSGNIDILKQQIHVAKNDYRDVLLNAEYPNCAMNMMKDLSDDESDIIYKKDCDQFQSWFFEKVVNGL